MLVRKKNNLSKHIKIFAAWMMYDDKFNSHIASNKKGQLHPARP